MSETVNQYGVKYRRVNDIFYNDQTPDEVITVLEQVRKSYTRIRVWYGNSVTGQLYSYNYNTVGYIEKGSKIHDVVFCFKKGSNTIHGIETEKIIRIETTRGKRLLYRHPKFHIRR